MFRSVMSRGLEFYELRMWNRWNTDHTFHPGNNGLMMEKDAFIKTINKVKDILDDENCNTPIKENTK